MHCFIKRHIHHVKKKICNQFNIFIIFPLQYGYNVYLKKNAWKSNLTFTFYTTKYLHKQYP